VRRLVGAQAALVAVMLTACQVYDPSLTRRDGGRSACDSRLPPERPAIADGTGPEVVFALRHPIFSQDGDLWRDIGYDLDGLCTGAPDFPSECRPPALTRPEVDGNSGIDNVFGSRFYPLVNLAGPDLEGDVAREEEAGRGNMVIRIFGWNGEADDPRVDIHMITAVVGTAGGAETEAPPLPADPSATPPRWDGRDWFWARSDGFFRNDPTQPLIRDDNAYIVDDVIVARLPERISVVFPAGTYAVLVRLTDSIATARITADRSGLETATVAGRWSVLDVLESAPSVGVCPGERDYELLVEQMDRIADLRSTPGSGGPDVACDAISIGVEFTGSRIRFAGLTSPPELGDPCLPDGGVADGGSGDAGGVGPEDGGMVVDVDAGVGGELDGG
jgi:hypothetical protein